MCPRSDVSLRLGEPGLLVFEPVDLVGDLDGDLVGDFGIEVVSWCES